MRSSTSPTPSSPHNTLSSSSSLLFSSSSSKLSRSAGTHTNAEPPTSSTVASPSSLPLTASANVPSTSEIAAEASSSSAPSTLLTPNAARMQATPAMSEAADESHADDPSASIWIAKPAAHHNAASSSISTPASVASQLDAARNVDFAFYPGSTVDASTLPSESASPGAQTNGPTSTVSTLQLASEALSAIPPSHPVAESVPPAAAELLSAIHRKSKKARAVHSPVPGLIRSRSAATTPVPSSSLLGAKNDAFDVTANNSRATTPNRTPSGRAKRQRRERNLGTPTVSISALPSIEQNDRRRSARVAQTVTMSTSDSTSLPNLALFGFSPYLENLVMNARETDRRTRSGGRGIRPPVDRAPIKVKRSTAKNKNKDIDPDGPDEEAKLELYRELCIISYQLQAHLDMVPHKSLEQLRAQFDTPTPEYDDVKLASTGSASAGASNSAGFETANGGTLAPPSSRSYDAQSLPTHAKPVLVKAESPQSPQLYNEPLQSRPPYTPESSPEVPLMDTFRQPLNGVNPSYPAYPQEVYTDGNRIQLEPQPWTAKIDEPEDDPMSPVFRPARSNIMSISALMSGPSPSKQRSPSPEFMKSQPRPTVPLPTFMEEWTPEDEMASRFLQACADAAPRLDTTELDRLTQIAQLAAFDLEMLSTSSSPRSLTPSLLSFDTERQQRRDAIAKLEAKQLNPLETLDTQTLYDREEAQYLEETQLNEELYESVQYLSSYDQVVDEWRAGELSRLRLQLEMRKQEVDRIWTCDRKLAWSTFVDNRAGELYRKAMTKASRKRWQAEMELDLLEVHRRKTRGLAKLTKDIFLPDAEGVDRAELADLYKRHGKFVSATKYPAIDEPLVRGDIRTMRIALRAHRKQEQRSKVAAQAIQSAADAQEQGSKEVPAEGPEIVAADGDAQAEAPSASESDSEENSDEYDSDSSYASTSSALSSLPSFSSVYSSPILPNIADVALEVSDLEPLVSEVASVRNVDDDSDEDADESLWARQIRLANQLAEPGPVSTEAASGDQTPAAIAVANGGETSAMPSRAASPAPSAKAQARKPQRERKRKKRPPPPGARLWKKGRVQHDAEGAHGEQVDEMQPSQQHFDPKQEQEQAAGAGGHYQNGKGQQYDIHMAAPEVQSRPPSPKMRMDDYDYRRGPDHFPHQAYERYDMPPSYLPARDEYEYRYSGNVDPYSRGYAGYAPPLAPAYPSYSRDAAGYGEVDGQMRYGSPPPSDLRGPSHYVPSYVQYEQGIPGSVAYPSHPPPPQQNGVRPSWPYPRGRS